jgi:hypothetical protein
MLTVPMNITSMQREAALRLGEGICLAIDSLAKGTIAEKCALSVTVREDNRRTRINVFADEYPGDSLAERNALEAWAVQVIEAIPADYDATVIYAAEDDETATIVAERSRTK